MGTAACIGKNPSPYRINAKFQGLIIIINYSLTQGVNVGKTVLLRKSLKSAVLCKLVDGAVYL